MCNWFVSGVSRGPSHISEGLWIAYLFSQLTWAAVWLVRGQGWLFVRMLPPLAIMESITIMFERQRLPMSAMIIFFGIVAICLLIGSGWRGWRRREPAATESREGQFSIRQLLGLTTCVALMFGFARLHSRDLIRDLPREILPMTLICSFFAAMALAGVWIGFSQKHVAAKLLLTAMIALLLPGLMALINRMGPDYGSFVIVFLAQAVFVAAGLAAFRFAVQTLSRTYDVNGDTTCG